MARCGLTNYTDQGNNSTESKQWMLIQVPTSPHGMTEYGDTAAPNRSELLMGSYNIRSGIENWKSNILFPSFQAGFSNPQHKPHTDAERSVGRLGQIILCIDTWFKKINNLLGQQNNLNKWVHSVTSPWGVWHAADSHKQLLESIVYRDIRNVPIITGNP